ncbi:hypothetical protein D9M71_649160 [compost metagenome]
MPVGIAAIVVGFVLGKTAEGTVVGAAILTRRKAALDAINRAAAGVVVGDADRGAFIRGARRLSWRGIVRSRRRRTAGVGARISIGRTSTASTTVTVNANLRSRIATIGVVRGCQISATVETNLTRACPVAASGKRARDSSVNISSLAWFRRSLTYFSNRV